MFRFSSTAATNPWLSLCRLAGPPNSARKPKSSVTWGGVFRGEEIIRVAQKYTNIYLDTSSIPYPRIIRQALDAIGPDRIVFASDNPAGDPVSDLAKIKNLHLPPEIEEKILYKNIAKMLKLELAGGRLK